MLTVLQYFLLLVFAILGVVPLLISVKQRVIDLFEPILFFSIFMLMTATVIFDRVYLNDPTLIYSDVITLDPSIMFIWITFLYITFYSFVLVGYYFRIEDWVDVPKIEIQSKINSPKKLKQISVLYIILGSICYILLLYLGVGSNLFRLFTTTEPRSEIFSGVAPLQLGMRMLYLGYFLWLIGVILDKNRLLVRHFLPVVPICGMILLLGARGRMVTVFLITVVIFYYGRVYPILNLDPGPITFPRDRLHNGLKLVSVPILGVIGGIVVFVSGAARSGLDVFESLSRENALRIFTFAIPEDQLDSLAATLQVVPGERGFYWGTFLLRVPLNYIPRAIWADKPNLYFGATLRETIRPDGYGGRPPGVIGRFYIEAGLVSIILGALLLGIAFRLMYLILKKNSSSPVVVLLYALFLSALAAGGPSNGSFWVLLNHILLLTPAYLILKNN